MKSPQENLRLQDINSLFIFGDQNLALYNNIKAIARVLPNKIKIIHLQRGEAEVGDCLSFYLKLFLLWSYQDFTYYSKYKLTIEFGSEQEETQFFNYDQRLVVFNLGSTKTLLE